MQLTIQEVDLAIDKIDAALPGVKDIETTDSELDHISDLAEKTFKDLVDLSMNVDPRFSGQILQSAGTLLGHALTAKQAKIDKKLRMVDLQIKKLRLDRMNANSAPETPVPVEGEGMVLDRNTLLREILNNQTKKWFSPLWINIRYRN